MKFRTVYSCLILCFFAFIFTSNRAGRPGAWAGAPGDNGTCATCHTSAGAGNIALTGAPATYSAGVTYNMTLTLTDASAIVGGFQIVATNDINNTLVGSFNPVAGQTLNDISRLVQSSAASFSGGSVSWPISWTAPSSGAPASLKFYFAGNAANNNFNNGSGDMGYSGSSSSIAVPVTLTRFDAKSNDEGNIHLSWETQSESNSHYFEVQRALNDQAPEFKTIGKINASGFSDRQSDYSFIDESPLSNQNLYYRLKQVDFDETFTYSPVQSVKIEGADKMSVYPNPIRSQEVLNFDYSNTKNQQAIIRIRNNSGKEVFAQGFEKESTRSLVLPDLSSGIYYVSIYDQENLIGTKRILVQD